MPGKLLKLEISQETNGHDCWHVNRYSIFNSSKTEDVIVTPVQDQALAQSQ